MTLFTEIGDLILFWQNICKCRGMGLSSEQLIILDEFLESSGFMSKGAIITDLDGTAVHEYNGLTVIHQDVGHGLKQIYDAGRPVVINTLRFPLSVIRSFGKEWYKISNCPIPVVLLNGSQLGFILKQDDGFLFDPIASFPLREDEINKVLGTVERFNDVLNDIILFYYPEDWKCGEIIWTAVKEKIPVLQNKYRSASSVISTPLEQLPGLLLEKPVCMILMLIEVAEDKLMAYQHTQRNNFFTREKIDKHSGSVQMAAHLGFNLEDSVGAGDSGMDVFLAGTGLAVHVRNRDLPFKGKTATIRLEDYHDFGALLRQLVYKQQEPQWQPGTEQITRLI